MTYDFTPKKSEYHRNSCKSASDMANLLLSNLDRLKETGHPKWKDVDLAALPPGWEVSNCVKQGMARNYKLECSAPLAAALPAAQAGPARTDQEYLNLLKQRLAE